MRLSVILSTYNAPAWLEKVIWGYATQTHGNFEIVVADDGSRDETAELIARLTRQTGLSIEHVWHEDRGFRKCEILNKAILRASAEYLVFSDGDCIPRGDFLETHARLAAPGYFLSGGIVRLPLRISRRIDLDDVVRQRATHLPWLARRGLVPRKSSLRMVLPYRAGRMLDRITTTKPTWNGHNASGWKDDLVRVNGFDQRMGYGGEDCELGERLVNAGVRPRQIRNRAVCVHLDHARGYVDQHALAWNQQHRETVRREGRVWTDYGILDTTAAEPVILKFPTPTERALQKAA
jgi:glycosyltransferase involved in cell wall biosynthesis